MTQCPNIHHMYFYKNNINLLPQSPPKTIQLFGSIWNIYCITEDEHKTIQGECDFVLKDDANNILDVLETKIDKSYVQSVCDTNATNDLKKLTYADGKFEYDTSVLVISPVSNVLYTLNKGTQKMFYVKTDDKDIKVRNELDKCSPCLDVFVPSKILNVSSILKADGKVHSGPILAMSKLDGTLQSLIVFKNASFSDKIHIIEQIINKLIVLKNNGFYYIDLKGENIAYKCTGKNTYEILFIDFGGLCKTNVDCKYGNITYKPLYFHSNYKFWLERTTQQFPHKISIYDVLWGVALLMVFMFEPEVFKIFVVKYKTFIKDFNLCFANKETCTREKFNNIIGVIQQQIDAITQTTNPILKEIFIDIFITQHENKMERKFQEPEIKTLEQLLYKIHILDKVEKNRQSMEDEQDGAGTLRYIFKSN